MLNECSLINDFKADLESDPKDYTNWLYNGGKMKDRPADLGYFIGYKIAETYYQKQIDKSEAIRHLLNKKKYRKIYKESDYLEKTVASRVDDQGANNPLAHLQQYGK